VSKHKIVIVGGGFGGIKLALELADDRRFHVTLVSEQTHFSYFPIIYRTATGGKRSISAIPLAEIFAGKRIHLIQDSLIDIDRHARVITTKVKHKIAYDALVVGIGVKTNYFHIEGLEKYSYGIKSIQDAEELKRHIHRQMIEEKRIDLNYVVVGGGPTGVELAAALPEYIDDVAEQHNLPYRKIHVDLVEAAPRLLPRMPKDISRMVARRLHKLGIKLYLGTAVQAQTADALMVKNKPIRSHTVIWTAGVINHPFFAEHGFQLAPNGKVRVDQFLQAEPGVYVIGDNADTPYSGMAQTALHDGKFIAGNLKRLADGHDPKPYVAKKPIYVFPIGPEWAAVLWGPLRLYGRTGWLLRRAADFIGYRDYLPFDKSFQKWVAEGDTEETCPGCADHMASQLFSS
jgi:NADH:ubiquinone reductase (H+-translocating)